MEVISSEGRSREIGRYRARDPLSCRRVDRHATACAYPSSHDCMLRHSEVHGGKYDRDGRLVPDVIL